MADDISMDEIEALKVPDLKKHLSELGLSKSGKKGELVERLRNAMREKLNVSASSAEGANKYPIQSGGDIASDADDSKQDDFPSQDQLDIHADLSDDDIESNSNMSKSMDPVTEQGNEDKGSNIAVGTAKAENGNAEEKEESPAAAAVPHKRKWGGRSAGAPATAPTYITSKSLEELIPAKSEQPAKKLKGGDGDTVDLTADDDESGDVAVLAEQAAADAMLVEEGEVSGEEQSGDGGDTVSADIHSDLESGPEDEENRKRDQTPPKAKVGMGGAKKSTASIRLRETKAIGYVVEAPVREKSPCPPEFEESEVLHLKGLVRPVNEHQLRALFSRYGELAEELPNLWMDRIKTRAYAIFSSAESAGKAREELDGCRWPPVNTKPLRCDFSTREEFEWMKENGDTTKPIPKRQNRRREDLRAKLGKEEAVQEGEIVVEKKAKKSPSPELKRTKSGDKAVREWDRGKKSVSSSGSPTPPPVQRGRAAAEKLKEREKKKEDDTTKRKEKAPEVAEDKQPAKLLDQLFYKTKAVPYIYWMPLSEEAIAAKLEKQKAKEAERVKLEAERQERLEKEKKERHERMLANSRRDRPRSGGRSRSRSRDRGGRADYRRR